MVSRVPLVIDFQTQRFSELQENDDLDLTNSRLLNAQEVTVTGNVTANVINVADISATGNIQAAFFIGDGGLLSNISGGGGGGGITSPGGVTTQVQYNKAGVFGGDAGMTYNDTTNTLTVGNIITDGYRIGNIAGANITGWVANANVANIAAQSNTSIALNSEIANIFIAGGSAGDVLSTNGAGVVSWMTPSADPTAAGNVGEIQFNTGNLLDATNSLKTDGNSIIITNEGGVASITEYIYSNTADNSVTTYRARGDKSAPAPLQVGDRVIGMTGVGYTGNGSATYDGITGWSSATLASITGTISSTPTGTGRLPGAQLNFNVSNSVNNTSSTMTFAESGKLTVPGTMKVGAFSATVLRGITGTVGEMAAVTDASAGGKIAYWDTKNTRWSYIFDNSAV
jgi:hypothetical protein